MRTEVFSILSYGLGAAQSCIILLIIYQLMRSNTGQVTIDADHAILTMEIIAAGVISILATSLLFVKLWQIAKPR